MKKTLIALFSVILLMCATTNCGIIHNCGIVYADGFGSVSCKSAILMDFSSETIIYEKESNLKLPIASMVKLMTIYLTFKNIESGNLTYSQKITTSENAAGMGGSQVFIDPYVSYSVEDLLKSVIMASANDASVALAEAISGSEEQFVVLMNSTAKELGMTNTLYCNSTGLPAPNQYSTAKDCAIILKNVLKYNDYHKYSNVWMDTLVHPSGRKTELVNTNKLIKYYQGCDGGKTGSTNEAGYCLTTSANRDNLRLISVVIGSKTGSDRFKDSTNLLNYGFANYQNKQLVCKDVPVCEIETSRCKQKTAKIVPLEDFYAFDKKGAKSVYDIDLDLPKRISACKPGDKIGSAIISKEGNVVKTVVLTVAEDIEAMTFIDNVKSVIASW